MSKAFIDSDFKRFASFMTDDFVAIGPDKKKMTRDQVIKDFTAQRSRFNRVEWTKTVKHQKVSGVGHHPRTNHVEVEGHMTAQINFGDGKTHDFVLDATSIDDWVHIPGDPGLYWRLKRSETKTFSVKIDGKSASH